MLQKLRLNSIILLYGDLALREEDRNEMPLPYIQSILKRQTLPYGDNRGGRSA